MSAFDVTTINAGGVLAFESSGLLENLKTYMASSSADTAISAMEMIKKLCEGIDIDDDDIHVYIHTFIWR